MLLLKSKIKMTITIFGLALCLNLLQLPNVIAENNELKWIDVAAGYEHTLFLRSDGTVWSAGSNRFGQLGNGSFLTPTNHELVQVSDLSDVIKIYTRAETSFAIREDGTLWAWGNNEHGMLGNGTITLLEWNPYQMVNNQNWNTPVQVEIINNVVEVASAYHHVLALLEDGTVWAWGSNHYGQLGLGKDTISTVPVQVKELKDITSIAANGDHSMALKEDGSVWIWGYNSGFVLTNFTEHSLIPHQIESLSEIKSISAGFSHSLALDEDGVIWAWGSNGNDQLGGFEGINTFVPQQINLPQKVRSIYSGGTHNTAVLEDGSTRGWGNNFNNQLAGSTSTISSPKKIAGISEPVVMSLGNQHSVFIDQSGYIWGFGANVGGQLLKLSSNDVKKPNILLSPVEQEPIIVEPSLDDEHSIKVILNGSKLVFDQPPVIVEGRTLVPLRTIFEALNADIEWDNTSKTVTSLRGDILIILTVGQSTAYVNDDTIELDQSPILVMDRTMVPARFIVESFGGSVDWDPAAQTVFLDIE